MRQFFAKQIMFASLFVTSISAVASETLIITGSSTWQPVSFINAQGEPDGIMVDYWKLYAQKNQVNIQFKLMPWSDSLQYTATHDNVIHGSLGYSTERAKTLSFSHELPLRRYDIYLFVKKYLPFDDLQLLNSAIVGTVYKSAKHEFLSSRLSEENIRIFPTFGSLTDAAYRGEVDVFIDDLSTAIYDMNQTDHSGLFTPRRKLHSFPLHFAMKKDAHLKLVEIEQGLHKLTEAEIDSIYQKWLPNLEIQNPMVWLSDRVRQFIFLALLGILTAGMVSYRHRFKLTTNQLKKALSALNDSKERLQFMVQNDALTGAKTRSQFYAKLAEQRYSKAPYAVAVIAITHLKQINETYGQDIGDMALRHLATQMRLLLPSKTTLARINGGSLRSFLK